MHLNTHQPGRLLVLEHRKGWLEHFAGASMSSVRITPEEVVVRRGWRRLRLARSQVRTVRLEHVRARQPGDPGRVTLWLEVRDEDSAGSPSGGHLEAFSVCYPSAETAPLQAVEELRRALAEFDLRPSLTGDPLPTPLTRARETPPDVLSLELRDLTPTQCALVVMVLPGLVQLLAAGHWARRLLVKRRMRRELPGAGIHVLHEGVLSILPGKAPLFIPRTAVLGVNKVRNLSFKTPYVVWGLRYRDVHGVERMLPTHQEYRDVSGLERALEGWLEKPE